MDNKTPPTHDEILRQAAAVELAALLKGRKKRLPARAKLDPVGRELARLYRLVNRDLEKVYRADRESRATITVGSK